MSVFYALRLAVTAIVGTYDVGIELGLWISVLILPPTT